MWLLGDECECGDTVGEEVPETEIAVGPGSVQWQLTLEVDQRSLLGGSGPLGIPGVDRVTEGSASTSGLTG